MNKEKSIQGKFSLVSILYIGTLVLGIGCISWALINIGQRSVYSADAISNHSPSPTTFMVKQVRLTEDNVVSTEPDHSSGILSPDISLYPLYPAEGCNIGSLTIPALNQKLPIIEGTDEDELKKGVGHFTQSVLPGEKDNCVLSGHRDTVFTKLDRLKIGDQLITQTSAGTYTYEIKRIRIVDKDDKTVIVPSDHAVLTLSTCYPFHVFGSAQERYIIMANLVE